MCKYGEYNHVCEYELPPPQTNSYFIPKVFIYRNKFISALVHPTWKNLIIKSSVLDMRRFYIKTSSYKEAKGKLKYKGEGGSVSLFLHHTFAESPWFFHIFTFSMKELIRKR